MSNREHRCTQNILKIVPFQVNKSCSEFFYLNVLMIIKIARKKFLLYSYYFMCNTEAHKCHHRRHNHKNPLLMEMESVPPIATIVLIALPLPLYKTFRLFFCWFYWSYQNFGYFFQIRRQNNLDINLQIHSVRPVNLGDGVHCGKNKTCSTCEPCYPTQTCDNPLVPCPKICRQVGSEHFCNCAPGYVSSGGDCIKLTDCPEPTCKCLLE